MRVDHHVDIVAGQREAGHANHVIHAHRHRALALGHHGGKTAFGTDGREPALDQRLAALQRHRDDPAFEFRSVGEGACRHAALGPVDHAHHLGRNAPPKLDLGIGHRDTTLFAALLLHPACREYHRSQAGDERNNQHQHAP